MHASTTSTTVIYYITSLLKNIVIYNSRTKYSPVLNSLRWVSSCCVLCTRACMQVH